jgi:S1-C subfamily serine protease
MGTAFVALSKEVEAVVDATAGSLVRVEGGGRRASSGTVWSSDGLVVAAHHAVHVEEAVGVGLPDGRTAAARVVGWDPGSDLALLQCETGGLAEPRWASTAQTRPGQLVLGLSRPGRVPRARLGIVSTVSDEWRTPSGARLERYLESDLALHAGFSGGPLLDAEASVLGVNTAGILRGTSLAVPAEGVRRIVEELRAHGRVRRGYLGIGTQMVALGKDERARVGQETALLVLSVQPDSPAHEAGLLLGDALLRSGERRLTQPGDLLPLLDAEGIGRSLPLEILRAGEVCTVSAEVGERGRA